MLSSSLFLLYTRLLSFLFFLLLLLRSLLLTERSASIATDYL
jgi:hypothetical protein